MFIYMFIASCRFSPTCILDTDGQLTCTACQAGYTGRRCEQWVHRSPHPYHAHSRAGLYSIPIIQCVPIKRKPVLSVGYLHCHTRFNQTIYFIIKGIFSSFIWYQNTCWYLKAWLKRNNLISCMSKSICTE